MNPTVEEKRSWLFLNLRTVRVLANVLRAMQNQNGLRNKSEGGAGPRGGDRAARIASYVPRDVDAKTWAAIGPLLRDAVTATAGEPAFLLSTNSRFLAWAMDRGLDVSDAEAVYLPRHCDRFIADDCRDLISSTRASMRSALTRTALAITKKAAWPARPERLARRQLKAPYDARDLELLELCAAAQRFDIPRRAAETFLCLGLGAGPDPGELFGIYGRHVVAHSGFVCVEISGERSRVVPVRLRYVERVLALADAYRDEPLIGPWGDSKNRVNDAARRIQRGRTTPTFNAGRFRNTWLLGLFADPAVSTRDLLEAAGLKTLITLSDLVPYLPVVDRSDAMARLAGETSA